MLAFAEALLGRGAGLRVLNLGRGDVHTRTPVGFTMMAALVQMERAIKRERIMDSGGHARNCWEGFGLAPPDVH